MKRLLAVFAILAGCAMGQIETWRVDLSDPNTYLADGTVYMSRDSSGNLILKDQNTALTYLNDLVTSSGGITDHAMLTGLAGDDHTHYYNQNRLNTKLGTASTGYGASYIGSLPISGAIGGTTTIGAFISDTNINYPRPGKRAVVAKTNGQYSTIQSAISALSAAGGGTVDVAPGIYEEYIILDSNITINGAPGAILRWGGGYPPAVKVPILVTGCIIRGMQIESSNTSSGYPLVDVSSNSELTIVDCVIDGSSSYSNTKTLNVDGSAYVWQSRIISQRNPVYVTGNCEIYNSAIYTLESSSVTPVVQSTGNMILHGVFIDGLGTRYGIQIDGGTAYVYGSVIRRCAEDIYCTSGDIYSGGNVYHSETGTVIYQSEGTKKVMGLQVFRSVRGAQNAIEYRTNEGLIFYVNQDGDIWTSGSVESLDSVTAPLVKAMTFDTNTPSAGVTLSGTTLSADGSNAAIDIYITPKGTGAVNISKVDINSGAIDGTAIGSSSASTGKFSSLSVGTTTWLDYTAAAFTIESEWANQGCCLYSESAMGAAYYQLSLCPGTIVTQIRGEAYSEDPDDRCYINIVRRQYGDGSGWTAVVSGFQHQAGGAETYNCTDFTITEGYIYAIQVSPDVSYNYVILFSVGLETSLRGY